MDFVNPELLRCKMLKSPHCVVKEEIRKIVCDKYGIEGDCVVDEMIEDIVATLFSIKIY